MLNSFYKQGIFILLCIFSSLTSAQNISVSPYEKLAYLNPAVGFGMIGPKDWFLEMKSNPFSDQAAQLFKSNNLYAVYSMYNVKDSMNQPGRFNPVMLVFFEPPSTETALNQLNAMYAKMENTSESVFEPPHEVTYNGHTWAVMATNFKVQSLDIKQVTYLLSLPKATVHIEALTTSDLYNEQRKLFDNAIARAVYGNQQELLNQMH